MNRFWELRAAVPHKGAAVPHKGAPIPFLFMTSGVDFFSSLHFAKQMSCCGNRMIENHSWSRPSHDRYDALLHFRSVAMYGTFPASGLFLAVTTSAKSVVGVIQELLAVGT